MVKLFHASTLLLVLWMVVHSCSDPVPLPNQLPLYQSPLDNMQIERMVNNLVEEKLERETRFAKKSKEDWMAKLFAKKHHEPKEQCNCCCCRSSSSSSSEGPCVMPCIYQCNPPCCTEPPCCTTPCPPRPLVLRVIKSSCSSSSSCSCTCCSCSSSCSCCS